ncbi:Interleukin-21 receptor [Dissostichus eleginoides]|uniref:Interleukin-21 receptor n=1 Tax=Dissostichus eleginoides TaxID=100907 RepID=A0AAD9C568_DISEL|nr:Interleukin-21 receptor [Dissostichus eleginoides]
MALKHLFLLLLWDLTLIPHVVTSLCNVNCTTDFKASLNCSCLGSVPPFAVLLNVTCSYYELVYHGSCEVKPPLSWCVMQSKDIDEVASVETECTTTVSQQGDDRLLMNASVPWRLADVVKPPPPVGVQVTNTDGIYNITWHLVNEKDCLTYSVRIRESKNLSKDPVYSLSAGPKRFFLLDSEKLQSHVRYTVDIQAKMCPDNEYFGPWSEWSSSAEWRTTGTSEIKGRNEQWWYISLPVIFVLVLLGFSKKSWWQKKLQQIVFIPKADEFFKPLDLSYGGNFKEWVKPVFSECDYVRINPHAQMISEKQPKVLQRNNEKQSNREGNGMNGGVDIFHMLQPNSDSLLFFQDGGSSQGAGHSIGHLSIHTVTLSGEEEFEEEGVSQSSVNTFRSYQDENISVHLRGTTENTLDMI